MPGRRTAHEQPSDAPEAWIALNDTADGELEITGNSAGLAALANVLQRCAGDSPEDREYRSGGAAADALRNVIIQGSEVTGVRINVLKAPPAVEALTGTRAALRDKLDLVGCGLAVFIVGGIFVAGLVSVLELLW